jgi:hypothetical protein
VHGTGVCLTQYAKKTIEQRAPDTVPPVRCGDKQLGEKRIAARKLDIKTERGDAISWGG